MGWHARSGGCNQPLPTGCCFFRFPGKNPKFPCGIWRFGLRKWWMWPMPWGRSPSILHPWGSSWLRAMDWCLTAGWGNKRWQDVTTFCGCGMMWLCKHDASIFETLDTSAMQKKEINAQSSSGCQDCQEFVTCQTLAQKQLDVFGDWLKLPMICWLFTILSWKVTTSHVGSQLAIGQGCPPAISSAVHRKRPSMKRERPSSTGQPGWFWEGFVT